MELTASIYKAIQTASILHKNQVRKGDGSPFITHPFAVALILADHTHDENIITAGILHDVLEDVINYSLAQLREDFGESVATIVQTVSEDKNPRDRIDERATWKERKTKYIRNLETADEAALMVSAADKIHNLLSTIDAYAEQKEQLWIYFNAPKKEIAWFYKEIAIIIRTRLHNSLAKTFFEVYEQAVKTIFTNTETLPSIQVTNKLVRDKIPDIIKQEEKTPVTFRLNQKEYIIALLDKLIEEAIEVRDAGGSPHEMMKEIGDVLEVLDTLIIAFGLDTNTIADMKTKRKNTRGGFADRIFLQWIE
ncbi:MAG: HD domain-containing protein [bacterium]